MSKWEFDCGFFKMDLRFLPVALLIVFLTFGLAHPVNAWSYKYSIDLLNDSNDVVKDGAILEVTGLKEKYEYVLFIADYERGDCILIFCDVDDVKNPRNFQSFIANKSEEYFNFTLTEENKPEILLHYELNIFLASYIAEFDIVDKNLAYKTIRSDSFQEMVEKKIRQENDELLTNILGGIFIIIMLIASFFAIGQVWEISAKNRIRIRRTTQKELLEVQEFLNLGLTKEKFTMSKPVINFFSRIEEMYNKGKKGD